MEIFLTNFQLYAKIGYLQKETFMPSIKEIAENWGVSVRRVNQLCNSGQIKGAVKRGSTWHIPSNTPRPESLKARKDTAPIHTTELLPCPVGITSYKEVSSECYYVDKTLLMKDIIDSHSKVTLFTRPRRFGKTLAMDMIKTFFEKTDEDTSAYFHSRMIWKENDCYKSYQGAYPVIFISFKDAHQSNWKNMYEILELTIRNEFKRHANILESNYVTETDKDFFRRMLEGNVSEVECQASLGILSHILSTAYRSRTVVIIDEYDTPIQQGYTLGYYKEIIAFMRNLFSAVLKDNEDLEYGILTGILRVAKESLFSGLNNLSVNTVLDSRYSSFFGFTLHEVEEMARYYRKEEKLEELKSWYDGYLFGKTEIYNPWSVISYFNNDCIPRAFWSRTSSNDMILEIIKNGESEMQEALTGLLENIPLKALVDTDIVYPEINSSVDSISSFLLSTGYLKVSSVEGTLDDIPICNLLIPNREIRQVFRKEILSIFSTGISNSVIRKVLLAVKSNDENALEDTLREYLLTSASFFDTTGESFYHGMMLGLLAIMSDDYRITSNRESGEGRFDISLNPYSKNKSGILMEFKAIDDADREGLESAAQKAIDQIIEKEYAADMRKDGIRNIQLYGLAFSGKKVAVKTMRLES